MKSRESRAAWRRRAKRWRDRNLVKDAWRCHRWNSKQRGIPVLWDFDEFAEWCRLTGYHILRKDGYQIHRKGDVGPYRACRCQCIPQTVNRRLQAIETKKAAWKKWRQKVIAENLRVAM